MSRFVLLELDEILVEGEYNCDSLFIHSTFTGSKFTKTTYLDLLEIWDITTEGLKAKGVKEVFSFIPKDNKIAKWQEMFGMTLFLEFKDNYMYRRVL